MKAEPNQLIPLKPMENLLELLIDTYLNTYNSQTQIKVSFSTIQFKTYYKKKENQRWLHAKIWSCKNHIVFSYIECSFNKHMQTFLHDLWFRGASKGPVWLSWLTPLFPRYSALMPIKYISNAATVGLWCRWFGTSNQHFTSNIVYDYIKTTCMIISKQHGHWSMPCRNSTCGMTWNNLRFWTI